MSPGSAQTGQARGDSPCRSVTRARNPSAETRSSQYRQVKPVKAVPQLLPLNQLEHFYRGGQRIAVLRGGSASPGMSSPEEWLASMTTMSSEDSKGLSRLGDGSRLRDA